MASFAINIPMTSSESKLCFVVIEFSLVPFFRAVAVIARLPVGPKMDVGTTVTAIAGVLRILVA
jgi:hypothetical protein